MAWRLAAGLLPAHAGAHGIIGGRGRKGGVEGSVVTATAGLAAAEMVVATGLSAAPEAGAREAMAGAVRATGGQGLAAAAKANHAKTAPFRLQSKKGGKESPPRAMHVQVVPPTKPAVRTVAVTA